MKVKDKILTFILCTYVLLQPLIPYGKLNFKGFNLSGDLVLGFILIVYLIYILTLKDSRFRFINGFKDFFSNPLSICMFLITILMFISITYASDKKIALSESIRFLSYVILYFIIKYEFENAKAYDIILRAYILVCFIASSFGIYQYFTGIGLAQKFKVYKYTKERIASTLDNPNNFAAFLVLAIFPIIMISVYEKNKIRKILYSFTAGVCLIALVLTSSRSALIGLGIGLVSLAVLYNWKFIFIFIFGGGAAVLIPQVSVRLKALSDPAQNESRVYLWKTALKMIKEHPVLGVGNGNFVSLYDSYVKKYPELKYPYFTHYPSHNSYLKVESELGILGIIFFIGLLYFAFASVKSFADKCKNDFNKYFYIGFLASMAAFYCMNFVDNLFFVPKTTAMFWILLAVSQALSYRQKNF